MVMVLQLPQDMGMLRCGIHQSPQPCRYGPWTWMWPASAKPKSRDMLSLFVAPSPQAFPALPLPHTMPLEFPN